MEKSRDDDKSCATQRFEVVQKNGSSALRQIITTSDLASLCVVSESTIARLTKSGVLRLAKDKQRRVLRGRYELGDAMPRFVEHLRDSIARADPSERAYQQARARRMESAAQLQQLELDEKKDQLLQRERIVSLVSSLFSTVKAHLLAIPSRLRNRVLGLSDPCEAQAIIESEVRSSLTEIADADVKKLLRAPLRSCVSITLPGRIVKANHSII